MSKIRFGTNGWRGVYGRDFDAEGVAKLGRALARCLGGRRERPLVLIAFDTRAHAEEMARVAAAALAEEGAQVLLCDRPTATPVAAFHVRARGAAAGVVVTASHNPPEYLGAKILAPSGEGAARPLLEALAREANALRSAACGAGPRPRRLRDPERAYLARLEVLVDSRAIRRSRPRVLYDAMHGTGAGVVDRALAALGARIEVMRGARDPGFGGGAPDPVASRLGALRAAVRERGFALGIATDGDADRFALVDARGRSLSETDALAVVVDHLASTRRLRRGLSVSIATGRLAERVGRAHRLPVRRAGLGFSALARALREGDSDIAGEESGGFAWRRMGFDKDGILAAALAVEAAAHEPLAERLTRLAREHGRSACGRAAVAATPASLRALARLAARPPMGVGGHPVRSFEVGEGVHLTFDDGFLLWRASGTEPLIRVYAEACSEESLARRLAAGAAELR